MGAFPKAVSENATTSLTFCGSRIEGWLWAESGALASLLIFARGSRGGWPPERGLRRNRLEHNMNISGFQAMLLRHGAPHK